MRAALSVVRKSLFCSPLLILMSVSGLAQTPPNEALREIDATLQRIVNLLQVQAVRDADREDARILMQRLRLQADRLQPLENELKELRLRRASLEQELAAGNEKIRQAEENRATSDFARFLETQIEASARELEAVEMSLQALEVRIRDREDALLAERALYDELAEAIDERLGLR